MNGAHPLFACMGPLRKGDLEKRLDRNWWQFLFSSTYNEQSLYLKTDGDVVEDPDITRVEADVFIRAAKLCPEDHILDLCCGQGRHTLELARRGYQHLQGLDFSSLLIQTAAERAKNAGLTDIVKFAQGDAKELPFPDRSFDAVLILGNSFGYFQSIHDDLAVLKEVSRILKVGGRVVLDLADGDYLKNNFQPRSWEWVDQTMFVCREREMAEDGQRLISREIITLTDRGVIKDQIYSERLFNFETISLLLQQAGMSDMQLFKELCTDSKRDQDLGMMEQRLVITGVLNFNNSMPTPETSEVSASKDRADSDTYINVVNANYPSCVVELSYGKGLAATRTLRAGEVVERFVGPIVSYSEVPESEKLFVLWVGPDKWLIPLPACNARHINHSCEPNCALSTSREIVTRRAIKANEQLTISYNVSTEDGEWDAAWSFKCHCKHYRCQGIINGYVDPSGRPFTNNNDDEEHN